MSNPSQPADAPRGFAVSSHTLMIGSALLIIAMVLAGGYLNSGDGDGEGFRVTSLALALPMVMMAAAIVRKLTKYRPTPHENSPVPSTGQQLDEAEIDAMIARHAAAAKVTAAAPQGDRRQADRRNGNQDRRVGGNRQQGFGRRSTDVK